MGLPPPPTPSEHPVEIGARTEASILAELVKRGYRVLLPFGPNQRYDLVVDIAGSFIRVQCKTARLREGCVVFNAQSIRSNTRKTVRRHYKDDVEMLIVSCRDSGKMYAIPIDEATLSQGTLRVDPAANGQSKRVRWARDYELPA